MMSKKNDEMLKLEIETHDDDRAFKRLKGYVMGTYKIQDKKQVKKGGNK